MNIFPIYKSLLIICFLLFTAYQLAFAEEESQISMIPDFSYCGYQASEIGIPDVPVRLILPLIDGDATALVQSAIDHISALPVDENGFRGAIMLQKGTYSLSGRLNISASTTS